MWCSDGQSCSQASCSFPGIRVRSMKAPAPHTGELCRQGACMGMPRAAVPCPCSTTSKPWACSGGGKSLCVSRSPPWLLSLAHLGAGVQTAAVLAPVAPCASWSCGTPALRLLVRMGKEGETCSACTRMPKLDPEPKSGSVGLSSYAVVSRGAFGIGRGWVGLAVLGEPRVAAVSVGLRQV